MIAITNTANGLRRELMPQTVAHLALAIACESERRAVYAKGVDDPALTKDAQLLHDVAGMLHHLATGEGLPSSQLGFQGYYGAGGEEPPIDTDEPR